MALSLYDLGTFDQLEYILEKFTLYSTTADLDNGKRGRTNESSIEDNSQSTHCHGVIIKRTGSTNDSNRRMSVPSILSRNKSLVKTRQQRTTSVVVGIPHRHHITIAVNDEPVDIIKTICTGPCLQSGLNNDNKAAASSNSDEDDRISNHNHRRHSSNTPSINTPEQIRYILVIVIIYVLSSISIRTVLSIFTTIKTKSTTINIENQTIIFIFYLLTSIFTYLLSINNTSHNNKLPHKQTSLKRNPRINLILSVLFIILWSSLHFVKPTISYIFLFSMLCLSLSICLLWDTYLYVMIKWRPTSTITKPNARRPHSHSHDGSRSLNSRKTSIYPMLTVISHSLHMWSGLLVFILLKSLSFEHYGFTELESFLQDTQDRSNTNGSRNSTFYGCGFHYSLNNYLEHNKQNKDQIQFQGIQLLFSISIGLNVISLIITIVLVKFLSNENRKPTSVNSIRQKQSNTYTGNRQNEEQLMIQQTTKHSMKSRKSEDDLENGADYSNKTKHNNSKTMLNYRCLLIYVANIRVSMTYLFSKCLFKFSVGSFFSVGLMEGFFITDYNEKFLSCYQQPSYIGLTMLLLAITAPTFVHIINYLLRLTNNNNSNNNNSQRRSLASLIMPVLICFLGVRGFFVPMATGYMAATSFSIEKTGNEQNVQIPFTGDWTFLLLIYPIIMNFDILLGLVLFYVSCTEMDSTYRNSAVVLLRVLRMLGIASYALISGYMGVKVALIFTLLVHCLLCPVILLVATILTTPAAIPPSAAADSSISGSESSDKSQDDKNLKSLANN